MLLEWNGYCLKVDGSTYLFLHVACIFVSRLKSRTQPISLQVRILLKQYVLRPPVLNSWSVQERWVAIDSQNLTGTKSSITERYDGITRARNFMHLKRKLTTHAHTHSRCNENNSSRCGYIHDHFSRTRSVDLAASHHSSAVHWYCYSSWPKVAHAHV